ncbi:MAG TPA: twin-arginine translocase subunit TatC [Ktedonobacteraceae bacterium]|nr:twin-arginine translocase subunit TatC [Ktedonobacteraceae bacterium]
MATGNIDQQDDPLATLGGLLFNNDDGDPNDPTAMTLVDHLEELRWRIFKSVIAIAVFSVVAFIFREQIMAFLTWPLPSQANALVKSGHTLTVTGIGEGFTTFLKLSIAGGFVAALPVILYQTWAFVSPGLYQHEKKHAVPFIVVGLVLFLAGLTLGYIVLQYPVNFLVNFAANDFTELITVGSYFTFVAFFLLAFGVVFEIPLVLTFLSLIGMITKETLIRKRAVAHVGMWIAATLLTPGADLYSPIFLGVAMSCLYELSIIFIKVTQHMRERSEQETAA